MKTVPLLAALSSLVSAKRNILTENTENWTGDVPLIKARGSRDKNWELTGQTGWVLDPTSKELVMELAFIVNTTDDGVGSTEKIVNDDIVNISWAIPTNQHTSELVEYEAGVATFYKGAPGLDSTTPDAQWTVTQTLTKILSVTQTKTTPSAMIPT